MSECNATETFFHFRQSSVSCRPQPALAGRAVEQSITGPLLSPAFECATTFSKQSPVSNIPRGLCCSLNGIRGKQSQHSSPSAPAHGLCPWLMVVPLGCPRPGVSPESCPKALPISQFLLAFSKPMRSWLGFTWGCRGGARGMGAGGAGGEGEMPRECGGSAGGMQGEGAGGCSCGGSTEGWG